MVCFFAAIAAILSFVGHFPGVLSIFEATKKPFWTGRFKGPNGDSERLKTKTLIIVLCNSMQQLPESNQKNSAQFQTTAEFGKFGFFFPNWVFVLFLLFGFSCLFQGGQKLKKYKILILKETQTFQLVIDAFIINTSLYPSKFIRILINCLVLFYFLCSVLTYFTVQDFHFYNPNGSLCYFAFIS